MRRPARIGALLKGAPAFMAVCRLLAGDDPSPTNHWSGADAVVWATLRDQMVELQSVRPSLEELRTQQRATLQAVQAIQQQALAALDRHTALLSTQLTAVSEAFARQRQTELAFIRDSHRAVLTVVAAVAGALCLGLAVLAVVSARAMSRLATAVSARPAVRLWRSLEQVQGEDPDATAVELSSEEWLAVRLQHTLERLEHRILELENGAARAPGGSQLAPGIRPPSSPPSPRAKGKTRPPPEGPPRMSMTLREGAAIGFLPGAVRARGLRPAFGLLRPLKRLLSFW